MARGKKMAAVLASEAAMQERINVGRGEAAAVEAKAAANAAAIRVLAQAIASDGGHTAMTLRVAEQYVSAFNSIAKTGNTVVVPANVGDAGAMGAQAMGIFKGMNSSAAAAATPKVEEWATPDDMNALRSWAEQASEVPTPSREVLEAEREAELEDATGRAGASSSELPKS